MRVLIIGNFLSAFSRAKAPAEELRDCLKEKGWMVLWASGYQNRLCRILDMVLSVLGIKGRYEVAAVMVYSGPSFYWAEICAWFLKMKGRPFVLALHGGNLPEFSRQNLRRVQKLFSLASAIVAPSGYLPHQMGVRQDMKIIPNGIHLERFEFHLRRSVKPEIVWVRAFHNIYRPQMVTGIAARIAVDFPGLHITMVGQDKKDGSLEMTRRIIRERKLQNLFTLIEGVPNQDIPRYLKKADIFLNTAAIDNMPVSVIEAMACGLCIVSSSAGGVPFLIQDKTDGLLVQPSDEQAAAEAVLRLLKEPGLAEKLSTNARKKAQTFSWEKTLPLWQNLFKEIELGKEKK